tara:strand:- start:327 stop:1223 length:897 start_codon:yes stop_codon:yes gene_type:complete
VKQFQTFITEARTTKASSEAKRLGLVGDGHGDWYDRQGNLKAKTIAGELKMFQGRQSAADEVGNGGTAERGLAAPRATLAKDIVSNLGLEPKPQGTATGSSVVPAETQAAMAAAKSAGPLTIAFDKFDDEGIASNIFATVEELAKDTPYYIFPSRDTDIDELKDAYPEISESIIDDKNAETIFDVLQSLYENGFDAINIVVRKSRAKAITELAYEQNGELYHYVMLNVIPAEERTIREQYIAGDLFQLGADIEYNKRLGKVIRRGANHLICLDEAKEMFRCWISDAKEVSAFHLPVDF